MTTLRPILDGGLRERAMDAVGDVAAALTSEAATSMDHALASGTPGIALFHVALGEALGSAEQAERGEALLDEAIESVSEQSRLDPTFFGTTIGLSWTLSRVGRRLGEDDPDETDVDELVPRLLATDPWPAHFDLVNGLVGLGAYCLERLPRPSARAGLEAVVRQLDAMALHGPDCVTWYTTPAIYAPRADRFPDGHYDVGFAHGTAGVVALLAAALRAGAPGANELLAPAVLWLSAQRSVEGDSAFPSVLAPDGAADPARVAWCYGDPGVALALFAAGRALDDGGVVDLARETALRCVGRVETSGIIDATLCHGTAGAAHMFNRLGQALGDEQLLDLARYWFTRALDDWPPAGIAPSGVAPGPTDRPLACGLLDGVAGTGLALLTAATGADSWWDFPLLLGTTE